ncbi:MAG: hypothetical protein ACI9NC_004629 [Verrucomicrobiales bacterium]
MVVGTKANGRQNGSSSRHTYILDVCVVIASFFLGLIGFGALNTSTFQGAVRRSDLWIWIARFASSAVGSPCERYKSSWGIELFSKQSSRH